MISFAFTMIATHCTKNEVSVNATKCADIYRRNPQWKTLFFLQ